MIPFLKRVSRFEKQMDASMERFMFRHRVWGFCMMFIGMPILALAAVCTCTMVVVWPMALVCGWIS